MLRAGSSKCIEMVDHSFTVMTRWMVLVALQQLIRLVSRCSWCLEHLDSQPMRLIPVVIGFGISTDLPSPVAVAIPTWRRSCMVILQTLLQLIQTLLQLILKVDRITTNTSDPRSNILQSY